MRCKYDGEPKQHRSVKGLRQTSSYKNKCESRINVKYDRKAGKLIITELKSEHNHPLSEKLFQNLPKQRELKGENKKYVEDMMKVKSNPRLVQGQLKQKLNKTVLVKDIYNINARLKSSGNDGITRTVLEEIYEDLNKYEGVVAEIMVSEENVLEGIFIQDQRMQQYFDLYPEVIIVDATYKLNDRRMPLFVMLVIDGNGESQITALFLLKSENYAIITRMMTKFKTLNPKHENINIILSDKNFADRKAYSECFPRAKMQLCIYHVMQAWNREIAAHKMNINGAEKKEMLQILNEMLYAGTEAKYMAAYEKIIFPTVKDYIDKNWHPLDVRQQWATYCTDDLQNYLTRTTNRVESINQKLKTVITKYGKLNTFLKETLQCVESLNVERDYRTIASLQRKPIRAVNESSLEFKYRALLTKFAYSHFVDEMENLDSVTLVGEMEGCYILKNRANSVRVVSANAGTCGCRFFKTMSLPCRHIIFFLQKKEMAQYAPNLCHKRWLKSHLPADLVGENIQVVAAKTAPIMSQNEKFRKAHIITEKIAEMLSEKPMALFETFMDVMLQCQEAIADDQVFAIEFLNENGKRNIFNRYV